MSEITEQDREELGRLVCEGFTSGRLDCADGKFIAWKLVTTVWNDAEEEKS